VSLGYALRRIIEEYPLARLDPPAGHPLAALIRTGAAEELRGALAGIDGPFLVKGSPGRGSKWAAVPWLAIFDPAITTSATRGYYLVYLFPAHREAVHLSLAQGTVAAIRAHGPAAGDHLRTSGAMLRARLSDFADRLPNRIISLGTAGELPEGYEAAHILGLTYACDALGDERRLHADLTVAVAAYRALKARGGLAEASRPGSVVARSR
jgi:5-methylcytosine-specific restriction protein A